MFRKVGNGVEWEVLAIGGQVPHQQRVIPIIMVGLYYGKELEN